jgi:hypothetical protein
VAVSGFSKAFLLDLQSDTIDLSHNNRLKRLVLPAYLPTYQGSKQSSIKILSTVTSSGLHHVDLVCAGGQYEADLTSFNWSALSWGLQKLHLAELVESAVPEFPEGTPEPSLTKWDFIPVGCEFGHVAAPCLPYGEYSGTRLSPVRG